MKFFPKLALALTLCASPALAATWTGDGHLYDANRVEIGTYTLKVERTAQADGSELQVVTASRGQEIVHKSTCTLRKTDDKWSKTCDDGGSGGGYYFTNGLAQDYYELEDGTAFVTQLIFDGNDALRLLRTELRQGQAVRFFAEQLRREGAAQ